MKKIILKLFLSLLNLIYEQDTSILDMGLKEQGFKNKRIKTDPTQIVQNLKECPLKAGKINQN